MQARAQKRFAFRSGTRVGGVSCDQSLNHAGQIHVPPRCAAAVYKDHITLSDYEIRECADRLCVPLWMLLHAGPAMSCVPAGLLLLQMTAWGE